MTLIQSLHAREILDSRGNPTLEAEIVLDSGAFGRAAVPSGASTGAREAIELRDGDPGRYSGKGVTRAVSNINTTIADALKGIRCIGPGSTGPPPDRTGWQSQQSEPRRQCIAGRVAGCCTCHGRAGRPPLWSRLASSDQLQLPVPMMNIINGGAHADNSVDMQEFMVVPFGQDSFAEALRCGVEIFHALKSVLKMRGLNTAVGDEGGFAPDLPSNEAAVEAILEAIEKSGYRVGTDVALALDTASSEFFSDGMYHLESEGKSFEPQAFAEYLSGWAQQYPIVSIEDGMAEDDWEGWATLTRLAGDVCQLVGDDLFVTNTEIFRQGIEMGIANSILIKLNQIGTLTETLEAIAMAEQAGYSAVISHRSGETEDTTIADLAVATTATQIKTGSLCRSDRVAKYNQLLRIEEALGDRGSFAGRGAFSHIRNWS